jgi:hypothetical protein
MQLENLLLKIFKNFETFETVDDYLVKNSNLTNAIILMIKKIEKK